MLGPTLGLYLLRGYQGTFAHMLRYSWGKVHYTYMNIYIYICIIYIDHTCVNMIIVSIISRVLGFFSGFYFRQSYGHAFSRAQQEHRYMFEGLPRIVRGICSCLQAIRQHIWQRLTWQLQLATIELQLAMELAFVRGRYIICPCLVVLNITFLPHER